MRRLLAALGLFVLSLSAGDWLNFGGDPQLTGWQRRGKTIHTGNAGELKLLWKRTLDNQSKGLNSLTAPVMLGPIVTHRGIKELVFIGGASDNLYAVDADLGRIFWKRHITTETASNEPWPCGAGMTAAPVIAPPPAGTKINEDDDEGHTPMRPFYFVASDGVLHTIRPADGVDMAPPKPFVRPNANLSALNLWGTVVYATTSHGCGGVPDGMWSIDSRATDAHANFVAGKFAGPVAIDPKGAVHPSSTISLRAVASNSVYEATDRNIVAKGASAWVSQEIASPLAPVIANGVLYVLARGAQGGPNAVLYALDARTGKQLYSSGNAITSIVTSSALAVANGHICFGTFDNTLYCFGLPIEI